MEKISTYELIYTLKIELRKAESEKKHLLNSDYIKQSDHREQEIKELNNKIDSLTIQLHLLK